MRRLLILCEYGTLNGGERSMLATLDGIARAGYEPLFAAPPTGPFAEELHRSGIEVVSFEQVDATSKRPALAVRRQHLADILRRHCPDVLHANSLTMGRLSGPVAAELGMPSISHLRDIVNLSAQAVADLNHHGRLLAVSEATRAFHLGQGIDAEKISVLYNGIDSRQFCPQAQTGFLHDELKLPRGVPLLGTIGQISLRKGQDTLSRALSLIEPSQPFCWLIVGERHSEKDESREFEAQLRASATEGPLAGKIFFLGTRYDIDRILPELTMLIHPARQEPLGRVLLEAAASGCAIVATEVGGTREIFPRECEAAYLIPPDDAAVMARAIGELLSDSQRRIQLGQNARARVEAAFTIKRAAAGLLAHYASVRS